MISKMPVYPLSYLLPPSIPSTQKTYVSVYGLEVRFEFCSWTAEAKGSRSDALLQLRDEQASVPKAFR